MSLKSQLNRWCLPYDDDVEHYKIWARVNGICMRVKVLVSRQWDHEWDNASTRNLYTFIMHYWDAIKNELFNHVNEHD